ncbi:MAG: SMC-Scp complex subunit ScpB [Chitinophagaceae bacterium]|nr:MAG: SMC-Scp complex subunit ScpB [Chitinophagaceae bacterium]
MSTIIPHIEALIFASDKPLSAAELTEHVNNALGFIEDRASLEQVEAAVEGIKEKYDSEFYAFELKQSGGGWQFLTKPAFHKTVALINGDKFIKKLSNAALETLAIIAYKQPITKSEIESIRGVNCDYAVQKLLEKDLIIISGRNEEAVGKPLIYNTSKSFMDYFGINSADDLPKIREVLMEEYANATALSDIVEEQQLAQGNAATDKAQQEQGEVTVQEEAVEATVVNTGETITEELVEETLVETATLEMEDEEEETTAEQGDENTIDKSEEEEEEAS